MSGSKILAFCVHVCLACGAERGGQRATMPSSSAAGDAELVPVRTSDSTTLAMAETVGGNEETIGPSAHPEGEGNAGLSWAPEVQPEPIEPRRLSNDAAGAVLNRLPTWAAEWSKILKGFSPRKCVLAERHEVPASSGLTSEETWKYDLGFARRHKSLFRPSPDGSQWADIYVATFELGSPEGPLQAAVGDTSYLTVMNPRTGHARVLEVFGISCAFVDALWLDGKRLVAVGSCIDYKGEKQRPFVARVDLAGLVFERFDYPIATPMRFNTERYIRHRNPEIRF